MKTGLNIFRHLLVIVVLTCVSFSVNAQNKVDVIKLKNGNVLKGKIVRHSPNEFIEIKTIDNNFWKFDLEDIFEIRYKQKRKSLNQFNIDTVENKNSGLYYELNFGLLVGKKNNQNNAPFSFQTTLSYLHKTGLAFGLGIAYETFEEAQLPVFCEIKYHHKIKGLPAYLFCQTGYSFSIEDGEHRIYYNNENLDSKGGLIINPGIGLILGEVSNTKINLKIGYRYQKAKQEWTNSYTEENESLKQEFNRLSIHLGMIF